MNLRRSQTGLTFISWVIVMAIGGFFLYLLIKMVPIYITDYSVLTVMKSFEIEPDTKLKTRRDLQKIVQRRLKINGVYDFPNDNIVFKKADGKLYLDMSYTVKEPFIRNISIFIDFDHKTKMPLR